MQALGLTFMAAALCISDSLLERSIEMTRFKLIPIARRRCVLQAQIEPYGRLWGSRLCHWLCHRQAQPPVADRVLGKAPRLPARSFEQFSLKDSKGFPRETQRFAFALKLNRFEGYPSEGALRPHTDPPAQFRLLKLLPSGRQLRIHSLDGV